MTPKQLSIATIIVGLLIGLWEWQVDTVRDAMAHVTASQQAEQRGQVLIGGWSFQPAPVSDRATGMAFAFLLVGVGCFTYSIVRKAEQEQMETEDEA